MLAEAAAGGGPDTEGDDTDGKWMKGVRVKTVGELEIALGEAVERVHNGKKGMLIEVLM